MKLGDTKISVGPTDEATVSTSMTVTDWDWTVSDRPAVHIDRANAAYLTIGENAAPVISFTHPTELTGLAAILMIAAARMQEVS